MGKYFLFILVDTIFSTWNNDKNNMKVNTFQRKYMDIMRNH